MDAAPYDLCAYCPRLCRHVCPVAVGTSREAATPTAMMSGPWAFARGQMEPALALAFASLCVECGACTSACKLERPVTDLLRAARAELRPLAQPAKAPRIADGLSPIAGSGDRVAVESDPRAWAEALSRHLGAPVARLRTGDHLGRAILGEPGAEAHLSALRTLVGGRRLVVSEAASAEVAAAAGLTVLHLEDLLPTAPFGPAYRPCRGPAVEGEHEPTALACCGAAGPLAEDHPGIAEELGRDQARRLGALSRYSPDSRCARWLGACGAPLHDGVDRLLASVRSA
jgi:ferredoxin